MAHIPRPFKRPGIDLGGHGKSWQDVRAENLRPGDLVINKGTVTKVTGGITIAVEFISGVMAYYRPNEKVHTFTEARVG